MSHRVDTGLLDRMERAISSTGRVSMESWAFVQGNTPATFVGEIRMLPLLRHRQAFGCVASYILIMATNEEMAKAIAAYQLTGGVIDDPFTIAAALLLKGANDIESAKESCRRLFHLSHWPKDEQVDYCHSETNAERTMVVLRRIKTWFGEVEGAGGKKSPRSRRQKNRSCQT